MKPIPGFIGYFAEIDGRIFGNRKCNRNPTGQLRVLRPAFRRGTLFVSLSKGDGRSYTPGVHNLVLRAFIGPRPPGMEAFHIDGDYRNNQLINLRWATRSEKMRAAVRVWGRHRGQQGANGKFIGISQGQRDQIIELLGMMSNAAIGRSVGVSASTVSRVRRSHSGQLAGG